MRIIRSVLVLALVAWMPRNAHATVLVGGDLGEIARSAAAIVRGTVVETRTEWVDGRRRVETIVTVDVVESLKGGLSGRVTFQVPGGVMGRYRSVMVGAPAFHAGEEVVVCLGARPPALPYVLGLSQGVFRIRTDDASGRKIVARPALLADADHATSVQRGDPARRPQALETFTAAVRAALSQAPPPRRDPSHGDIERGGR
jgi:hypothetical protein